MIESLAHGYSSEGTHREPSNEYQYDRVYMIFNNLCAFDESRLSIGRVKEINEKRNTTGDRLGFN